MPVPEGLPAAAVIFYLHGFASSAQSTKARYFQERLSERGRTLVCPDFNGPDFRAMTMTRMLDQLEQAIGQSPDGPVALIGSSLGGTLAILAAERFGPHVDRVVLMAPAVMFAKPGHHLLPPERIEEWQRKRSLPFFHYGFGEERALDFGFYEDSLRYDAFGPGSRSRRLSFKACRIDRWTRGQSRSLPADGRNVTLVAARGRSSIASRACHGCGRAIEPFLGLIAAMRMQSRSAPLRSAPLRSASSAPSASSSRPQPSPASASAS